jgi:F-type H+-transporting ATPase subunit b
MELSPATIIIQIFNFILFLFIISKLFLRPVKKILDQREGQIKQDIEEAEALKTKAAALREEYENKLRDAHIEAQEIYNNAVASGETVKNEVISEAKAEARREQERAEEEIKSSIERAEKGLRSHVADLAVTIADKVLRETLDSKSHDKLLAEFVRKVESQNAV